MTNFRRTVEPEPASPRSRVPAVIIVGLVAVIAVLLISVFLVALRIGLSRDHRGAAPAPHGTITKTVIAPAVPQPVETESTGSLPPPTATPGGSPSKGIIAAKGAAADVSIGAPVVIGDDAEVNVQVTNHSSKTSSYVIQVALDAADGYTQLATASLLVRSLDSGASVERPAVFLDRSSVPPGATASVKSVQRLADE
jgi:hypothetical protein